MRRAAPLGARQLEVLRWVGNGCIELPNSNALKVSARALQGRGLARVSRKTGVWSAELTEAGRRIVADGQQPADAQASAQPKPRTASRRLTSPPESKTAPVPVIRRPVIPPDELMQRVRQEGRLVVPGPAPEVRAAWRRAIDGARRNGLVPDGKHLQYSGRDRGDRIIELRDGAHPHIEAARERPERLLVAEEVGRWHPTADGPGLAEISSAQQGRARRLLHTLATAASGEGLEVRRVEEGSGLVIEANGQTVPVWLYEELEEREVLPDAPGGKRYDWQRTQPELRKVPTGRLALEFVQDWSFTGRRRRFADRQRWSLDDKLADVLADARHRLDELATRQAAAEQAAINKQAAWEAAMERARRDFRESRKIAALDGQLANWEKANRVRAYCAELAEAGDGADAQRAEWIAWARAYADRLDPCQRTNLMPADVEPQLHELSEFLRGWSPYGPNSR